MVTELSSLPAIILNGLAGRKSHELMGLDGPPIVPFEVPVSTKNTCPKLEIYLFKWELNSNELSKVSLEYTILCLHPQQPYAGCQETKPNP
jgi:hypothetical protein